MSSGFFSSSDTGACVLERRDRSKKVNGDVKVLDWQKVGKALSMEEQFNELSGRFNSIYQDHWPIHVPIGLNHSKIVAALKKANTIFWSDPVYTDLDEQIIINDRHPSKDGAYTIFVKAQVEADEEFRYLSADYLQEQNHSGMTSIERLLLGFAYVLTTGEHLDIQSQTLCSASRDVNGEVPCVGWWREIFIYPQKPDEPDSTTCSRSIISIPLYAQDPKLVLV